MRIPSVLRTKRWLEIRKTLYTLVQSMPFEQVADTLAHFWLLGGDRAMIDEYLLTRGLRLDPILTYEMDVARETYMNIPFANMPTLIQKLARWQTRRKQGKSQIEMIEKEVESIEKLTERLKAELQGLEQATKHQTHGLPTCELSMNIHFDHYKRLRLSSGIREWTVELEKRQDRAKAIRTSCTLKFCPRLYRLTHCRRAKNQVTTGDTWR